MLTSVFFSASACGRMSSSAKENAPDTENSLDHCFAAYDGISLPEKILIEETCELTNRERVSRALPALRLDPVLTKIAQLHARDMQERGYFDHVDPEGRSPFDRLARESVRYSVAAENIARQQRTSEEVVEDWMASSGHRRNILDAKLRRIGVGYRLGHWVQVFTN